MPMRRCWTACRSTTTDTTFRASTRGSFLWGSRWRHSADSLATLACVCRTLIACSLALPASMPRQSRPSRLRRGSPCWLFFHPRAHVASIHFTPRDTPPLRAGVPWIATRSLPMDTQAIRAQMPTLVRGHVPSMSAASSSTSSTASPRFRRWASTSIPSPSRARSSPPPTRPSSSRRGGPSSRCSTRHSSPRCPTKAPRCRSSPMCGAVSTACARTRPRRAPSSPPTASHTR